MTHWQLKGRLLCIKLGSDTLEPVWVMITHRNTVTCMHLCNPSLNQAFIGFYADLFSVAHIYVSECA